MLFLTLHIRRLAATMSAACIVTLLALVVAPPSARGELLGVQIVVQRDTGSGFVTQGTAFGGPSGGSTPLIIYTGVGDTLRFQMEFDQPSSSGVFGTTITADDPTEIDFVNGSALELTGHGFASFSGNPNNSLNDATPASGLANTAGAGTVLSLAMYRVDYVVQAGVTTDGLNDFVVNLTTIGSGNTLNTAAREASVQVNAIPEPTALMLLVTGLTGLGVRRRSV